MPKRRVILTTLVLMAAGGLLAVFGWPRECPVEMKVVAVEPSGMLDDAGGEMLMVTLSVRNRDRVDRVFEAANGFEARSPVGDWMPVKYAFTVPRTAPGQQASVLLLAPPATSAYRLRLHYQTQTENWKCRVMEGLGVRGRTLVAKSPLLRKLVWSDDLKTMPVPPHWRQATIEAVTPGGTISPSGGKHNNRPALDAADPLCLHSARFSRRASEAGRSPSRL